MLWGSEAMGGVINITTKRGKGIPKASGFFEYGSFNSIREGGAVSGQQGPLAYAFSLSRWDVAGFSAINFRRGAIERDAYRNWQGSARLDLEMPMDGKFNFNFRWINADFDTDTTFGPSDTFSAKTTTRQYVFSGRYQQPITEWWTQILTLSKQTEESVGGRGTVVRNVVTGVVSPGFMAGTASLIDTVENRIEWQHNIQVGEPVLVTFGYQFRDSQGENISGNGFPNKIISSHSGFAQIQINLWDRLFGTAGFRQDSYNSFGDATTYRVTGGYFHKETGTKVRASYATGFRAPDINELFAPGFGTPSLPPEKSQSMDVGINERSGAGHESRRYDSRDNISNYSSPSTNRLFSLLR